MTPLFKYFKNSKTISIDQFLENALYDKHSGYYTGRNPFGKNGDFITSPAISHLFSEMIAIWIISLWENLKKPNNFNIIELGPGDGKLCNTLVKTFKKFPKFYKSSNIFLYEKSKFLRKVQRDNISGKKVRWLTNSNTIKNGPVIFFGNEFFDAIPIKQFKKKNGLFYEKFLQKEGKHKIKIILKKALKTDLKQIKKYKTINNSKFIEYPKKGFEELNWISKKIKKMGGGILLIDYGYHRHENKNTLQSIKSHKKNDVFDNVGQADITSLVNFGLLKNYFTQNKMKVNKIVSQSFFLKKLGILNRAEILANKMSFKDKSDLYLRLQRLLDARYMGELFKVIFAYKNKTKMPLGFI